MLVFCLTVESIWIKLGSGQRYKSFYLLYCKLFYNENFVVLENDRLHGLFIIFSWFILTMAYKNNRLGWLCMTLKSQLVQPLNTWLGTTL